MAAAGPVGMPYPLGSMEEVPYGAVAVVEPVILQMIVKVAGPHMAEMEEPVAQVGMVLLEHSREVAEAVARTPLLVEPVQMVWSV